MADGHWLTAERVRRYSLLVLACYLVVGLGVVLLGDRIPGLAGLTIGSDFKAFYTASRLVLDGRGLTAYDVDGFIAAQAALFPELAGTGYGWFYPPTALLLVAPLALLPYVAALALFLGLGLAGWLYALWRSVGRRAALPAVLAFPGLWMCVLQGQNGLLTGALAAGSVLTLRRHPVLSGVLVGLLAIKPHLAVLFPVAFVAARAWKAFASAAVTAVAFLGASVAAFGPGAVTAWAGGLGVAASATAGGNLPLRKMPSTFAMLRLLGTPEAVALGAHLLVAIGAAVAVWLVWRRSRSQELRGAVLLAATFLANPYAFDYDLAWLAFPIAWLVHHGLANGWLRGEREVLVAAWLLPGLGTALADKLQVQVGPLVLALLTWLALRRVLPVAERRAEPARSPGVTPGQRPTAGPGDQP